MTLMRYEDWMDYTELDQNGRMVPKSGAPAWVSQKIEKFYRDLEDTYPQPE